MYIKYGNGTLADREELDRIIIPSSERELNTYFVYESDCSVFTILESQPFKKIRPNNFNQECYITAIFISRVNILLI